MRHLAGWLSIRTIGNLDRAIPPQPSPATALEWSETIASVDPPHAANPERDAVVSRRIAIAGQLAVFSGVYYVAYHLGMSFSPTTASPFWFPDTILLCALLLTPPGR